VGKQNFTETELPLVTKNCKAQQSDFDIFTKPYSILPINNFDDIEGLVVSSPKT
jgi:hypothetical protein